MKKILLLIIVASISNICFAQNNKMEILDNIPANIDDYEITSLIITPIGDDLLNNYYGTIKSQNNYDVIAVDKGYVEEIITGDTYKEKKIIINHNNGFKSNYYVKSTNIEKGVNVVKGEKIGDPIHQKRDKYYYIYYVLEYKNEFLLTDIVFEKRIQNILIKDIISISKKIVENFYNKNEIKDYIINTNDHTYNLEIKREDISSDFKYEQRVWEYPNHKNEYEIFKNDEIELFFLKDIEKIYSIKTKTELFTINNISSKDITVRKILKKYGKPDDFISDFDSTSKINKNIDLIIEHGYLNENIIKNILYILSDEGNDYLINFTFKEGIFESTSITLILP